MSENEFSTYSIRPATLDDLPIVLEIEKKSYPVPCAAWTEQAFREEMAKPFSNFLVLTDDETDSRIPAYIVFWTMFDEVHILNVAVDPEWRGVGFATKLVRHAVNQAVRKNVRRVFLEVRRTNEGAIKLYSKLGFFVDHIKKSFYENGDDAYFMVLYINQPNVF